MQVSQGESKPRLTGLEIVLRLFTEIRPGEGLTALLLALQIFLTLIAYYILKPVREALILELPGGAEYKAYATAAVALLMVGVVPLYSGIVNRVPRNWLVLGTTLFFCGCMLVFYALGQERTLRSSIAIPFYLWLGVFNLMVVAQFWGFANDIYTAEQGQRLFAMIGIGQSAGAATGSFLTAGLLTPPSWAFWPELDVYETLLLSAAVLGGTTVLAQLVHRRGSGGVGGEAVTPTDGGDQPGRVAAGEVPAASAAEARGGGFTLVLTNPYLRLLAAYHLLFTFVNTNGEYILAVAVKAMGRELGDEEITAAWIGSFYGRFYGVVNLLGLLMQMFLVSRVVRYVGVSRGLVVLPVIVMLGSSAIAAVPVLAMVRVVKIAENSLDYSLNNTLRQMLWLPTSSDAKYKGKQATDTFFVRMGDASSGALVAFGRHALNWGLRGFALVNVGLAMLWLVLVWQIGRSHQTLLKTSRRR